MKKNRIIFFIVAVSLLVIGVILIVNYFSGGYNFQVTKASVTGIVKEFPIQLVTNNVTTMITCDVEDVPNYAAKTVFGTTEGVIITKVKFSYGMDLKNEFKENDVSIQDDAIVITLPDPKILYREIDFKNWKVYTKTSVLRAIVDKFSGTNVDVEFIKIIQEKADEFAQENGLAPTKETIIKSIEPFFNKIFAEQTKKKIIFR
jgi:hypothetical protein